MYSYLTTLLHETICPTAAPAQDLSVQYHDGYHPDIDTTYASARKTADAATRTVRRRRRGDDATRWTAETTRAATPRPATRTSRSRSARARYVLTVVIAVFALFSTLMVRARNGHLTRKNYRRTPSMLLRSWGVPLQRVRRALQEIERKTFHLCGLLVPPPRGHIFVWSALRRGIGGAAGRRRGETAGRGFRGGAARVAARACAREELSTDSVGSGRLCRGAPRGYSEGRTARRRSVAVRRSRSCTSLCWNTAGPRPTASNSSGRSPSSDGAVISRD